MPAAHANLFRERRLTPPSVREPFGFLRYAVGVHARLRRALGEPFGFLRYAVGVHARLRRARGVAGAATTMTRASAFPAG